MRYFSVILALLAFVLFSFQRLRFLSADSPAESIHRVNPLRRFFFVCVCVCRLSPRLSFLFRASVLWPPLSCTSSSWRPSAGCWRRHGSPTWRSSAKWGRDSFASAFCASAGVRRPQAHSFIARTQATAVWYVWAALLLLILWHYRESALAHFFAKTPSGWADENVWYFKGFNVPPVNICVGETVDINAELAPTNSP